MKRNLLGIFLLITTIGQNTYTADRAGVTASADAATALGRIDDTAKARLEGALGVFRQRLQFAGSDLPVHVPSLDLLRVHADNNVRRFTQKCGDAADALRPEVSKILRDFPVDVQEEVYTQYLNTAFKQALDTHVQEAFASLTRPYDAKVDALALTAKEQRRQAARLFTWGSSLVTNIATDVKEDWPIIATAGMGGGALLQYMPKKTREKLEEAVGDIVVKQPGKAVGAVAALFAGWQIYKYGSRYYACAADLAEIDKAARVVRTQIVLPTLEDKFTPFIPHILQQARESKSVMQLDRGLELVTTRLGQVGKQVEGHGRLLHDVSSRVDSTNQAIVGTRHEMTVGFAAQSAKLNELQTALDEKFHELQVLIATNSDESKAQIEKLYRELVVLKAEISGIRSDTVAIREGQVRFLAQLQVYVETLSTSTAHVRDAVHAAHEAVGSSAGSDAASSGSGSVRSGAGFATDDTPLPRGSAPALAADAASGGKIFGRSGLVLPAGTVSAALVTAAVARAKGHGDSSRGYPVMQAFGTTLPAGNKDALVFNRGSGTAPITVQGGGGSAGRVVSATHMAGSPTSVSVGARSVGSGSASGAPSKLQ